MNLVHHIGPRHVMNGINGINQFQPGGMFMPPPQTVQLRTLNPLEKSKSLFQSEIDVKIVKTPSQVEVQLKYMKESFKSTPKPSVKISSPSQTLKTVKSQCFNDNQYQLNPFQQKKRAESKLVQKAEEIKDSKGQQLLTTGDRFFMKDDSTERQSRRFSQDEKDIIIARQEKIITELQKSSRITTDKLQHQLEQANEEIIKLRDGKKNKTGNISPNSQPTFLETQSMVRLNQQINGLQAQVARLKEENLVYIDNIQSLLQSNQASQNQVASLQERLNRQKSPPPKSDRDQIENHSKCEEELNMKDQQIFELSQNIKDYQEQYQIIIEKIKQQNANKDRELEYVKGLNQNLNEHLKRLKNELFEVRIRQEFQIQDRHRAQRGELQRQEQYYLTKIEEQAAVIRKLTQQ